MIGLLAGMVEFLAEVVEFLVAVYVSIWVDGVSFRCCRFLLTCPMGVVGEITRPGTG